MSGPDALRDLQIKTGVVERIYKEFLSYQQELESNKKKVNEVRASTDHSRLKQWENVLGETQGMIPDTRSRLSVAVENLEGLLKDAGSQLGAPHSSAHLQRAHAALDSASTVLSK